MLLLLLLLLGLSVHATFYQIPEVHVSVNSALGDVRLYHSHTGFHVHHEGTYYNIDSANVDARLRKITTKKLKGLLKFGCLALVKNHNKFYLRSNISVAQ